MRIVSETVRHKMDSFGGELLIARVTPSTSAKMSFPQLLVLKLTLIQLIVISTLSTINVF